MDKTIFDLLLLKMIYVIISYQNKSAKYETISTLSKDKPKNLFSLFLDLKLSNFQ